MMTEEIGKMRNTNNFSQLNSQKAALNATTMSVNSAMPSVTAESHSLKMFKKLAGGGNIDFTFNTIKTVKKVAWKEEAPWYREVTDGFCWIAYCHNDELNQEEFLRAKKRAKYGPQKLD